MSAGGVIVIPAARQAEVEVVDGVIDLATSDRATPGARVVVDVADLEDLGDPDNAFFKVDVDDVLAVAVDE